MSVGGAYAAPSDDDAPEAGWRIKVTRDAHDNPHSTVDLIINGEQTVRLVTPVGIDNFRVLPRDEYADYKVPAKALCACYSWWAGSGTRLYAAANAKGDVEVYRLDEDEGMTSKARWQRIRTVKAE